MKKNLALNVSKQDYTYELAYAIQLLDDREDEEG